MPFGFHPGFLIILLIIVLIVFGPGRLPELGSAIGRSIREFRKESETIIEEIKSSAAEMESRSPAAETEVKKTLPEVPSEAPPASTDAANADMKH
jgi:sec-independent protein translocase protein TatA